MKTLIEKLKKKYKKVTLRLSDDKSLFYIPEYASAHDFWLSYEKIPGPVPKSKQAGGLFDPNYVEIKHKDGRIWHRKLYTFTFWKIRSQMFLTEKTSYADDRVQDYLRILDDNK